ncbi:hypothetical protein, partial [Massilia genomosp. 1]|uniref:hypothetical protein n=1 Tax=Massilia genomosp. 1 TaxID=2609280 RepID=UPI001C9E8951
HGVGVLIKLQKLNHARNGRPLPPFRLRCQAIFIRSASFARGSDKVTIQPLQINELRDFYA